MSILSTDVSKGKDLHDGTKSPYTYDDNADSMSGGSYDHKPKRMSAHAMQEVIDWLSYYKAVFNGSYAVDGIDINGGSIDDTPIGASTASTGAFTSLTVSGDNVITEISGATEDNIVTFDSSGNIQDSGYTLNDSGTATTDLWSANKIQAAIDQGFDASLYENPVIDRDLTAPPGSPSSGDRYIVAATATGDWASHENDIAEYNGSSWDFETPVEGSTCWVNDENVRITFNGTTWVTASAGGDMNASTYDPTAVSEQLVGLTATQSLTNKTVNGVVLSNGGAATSYLDETGNYSVPAGGGSPLTTKGDLYTYDTDDQRLAVGTNGQVLTADSAEATGMKWATLPSGFSDPMTTRGDVIIRNASNATDRLAVGTNGQVLTSDGTDISWQTPSGGSGGTTQGTDGNTYNIRATNEGATTGNARGELSVDLQTSKNNSSQVASGGASAISGGIRNTASGLRSTISGGYTNVASNDGASIGGGYSNTASGKYSTIPGGVRAYATHYNEFAVGCDLAGGSSQIGFLQLWDATNSTSESELFLDNSSERFTLNDNDAYSCVIHLMAAQADGSTGRWRREVNIRRQGSTTSLDGTVSTIGTDYANANIGSPTISITADDTNDTLAIKITPANTTTTRWTAKVEYVKINY